MHASGIAGVVQRWSSPPHLLPRTAVVYHLEGNAQTRRRLKPPRVVLQ